MINEQSFIKEASLLFSKYGLKSVSIGDVASELGISKKTIYGFISGKDELIDWVVDYNLDAFHSTIINTMENNDNVLRSLCQISLNVISEVEKYNPSYVYDLKKYHHKQYLKINSYRDSKLYYVFEYWITKGIHSGIFRNDTDIWNVFQNIMHRISVLISDSGYEWNKPLSANTVYLLTLNDIRGITTLKGHEIFDNEYETFLHLNRGNRTS